MSAITITIDKPSESLKERMAKAADVKRKINQYIQKHGTTKGLNIPGITFVKPL